MQCIPLVDEQTRVAAADDDAATYVGLDEIGFTGLIQVGMGKVVLVEVDLNEVGFGKCDMGQVGLQVVGLCPIGLGVVGMALVGMGDVGLKMLHRYCPWCCMGQRPYCWSQIQESLCCTATTRGPTYISLG